MVRNPVLPEISNESGEHPEEAKKLTPAKAPRGTAKLGQRTLTALIVVALVVIFFFLKFFVGGLATLVFFLIFMFLRRDATGAAVAAKNANAPLELCCSCPCGLVIFVTAGQAGTRVICPACNQAVDVPSYSRLKSARP